MEGSTGFQDPMQANYQCIYPPLNQPICQNQLIEGDPSSNLPSTDILDQLTKFFEDESFGNPIMKWTDEMAKLLITAVSYIVEAETSELNVDVGDASSKHLKLIPKMKKWKVISVAMSERGFSVSPQECEDKFRDINNKFTQLLSLLGWPTSCEVVENPILLESTNIPENQKQEARNILWSEQLLYREMCSLHTGKRKFLPHDEELQRSLFLIAAGIHNEQVNNQEGNLGPYQNEREVLRARWVELEEKSLEIQEQKLQFEKENLEWLCLRHAKEVKLEKARLENESKKLEHARLVFELKRRENNYS